MDDNQDFNQVINVWDSPYTDYTVTRVIKKVFNGVEYVDVRLWGRDAHGRLYPRKGKGLTMRTAGWSKVSQIFNDNGFFIKEDSTSL